MNGSIRYLMIAAVFMTACSSLSVGGERAPLYAAGATCNTSDRGSVIPCPGHDGVTTCIYQVCDPLSLTASTCEVYDCAGTVTPPAFIPNDGSAGCTPGATSACTTPGPSFRPGTMICDVSGNWQECIPSGMPFDAGPSGVILDGGIVGTACNTDPEVVSGVACTVGVGACRGTGVWMCDAMNVKVCSAMAGTPTSEGVVPDGVDNDCNGLVDDSIVRGCYSGPAGTSGIGVCRPGTQSYIPATMTFTACTGQVLPSAEVADNAIDEDCNGALLLSAPCGADPRIGLACSAGIGACRNTGTWSCVGSSLVCNAVAGTPAPEACDNLDNDCDGVIDGNVESCYTGPVGTASIGLCRAGTRTCTAGVFGACTGETLPALEVCGNALDEDCNGINDACVSCGSDPRVGSACAAGIGACLRTGIYSCAAGVVSCNAIIGSPVDETCNAVDDDCDGTTDEDVARSCGSFDLSLAGRGICRAGTQTCLGIDGSGAPVFSTCTGAVGPATETCGDTIDQDCSGSDLACTTCGGDPRIGMTCTIGRGACAATGTYQCMSGSDFRCVTSTTPAMPTPEVCDGIDNDCNGLVDDATGGGALTRTCYPFTTGAPGVGICRNGTQVCSAGAFSACSGAVGPATEICDTLDNDCDGGVNEGLACGVSDAGVPSVDAGIDSGVDGGVDAGTSSTDAGVPLAGTAAAERAACRDIRLAQGSVGTITLTYDLACLNGIFGTCAAGWSPLIYDSNGCTVPADPGTMSVTVDLAMVSSDPSSFYRTGLRCGGPGGTRFNFPGPSGTPAEMQCVTSWVINGVSRQGSICNGSGGLLPTFSANPTVARYVCP